MAAVLNALMSKEVAENYISPFFHLNAGEDTAQIAARMQALKDIGIHAVTIEYTAGTASFDMRLAPFDDAFMAVIDRMVAVCRQLDMRFWLQDAAPFPTGQANGWLEKPEYAHLNKLYLDERHIDVAGPRPGAVLHAGDLMLLSGVKSMIGGELPNLAARRQLCTVACRREESGVFDEDSAVLLDDFIHDGLLYWDVPEGQWRVFSIFTTYDGGGRRSFMNLLSRDSVQLEIEAVHQPIYNKLKDELGKTWNGFFYDEPEIGNVKGFDFNVLPGRKAWLKGDVTVLPWSDEMPAMLAQRSGRWKLDLPLLWYDGKRAQARARYWYMDSVTRLVQQNYSQQVSEWCRRRGVGYIGHVLEDESSHGRLGCGAGHYFRVQRGQDMAGIDLISGQVMPGSDRYVAWYGEADGDGEFYHYGLAKLASSAAHIDPGKNHQSVCELLAVYGAVCGPLLRKFVIDHLLVNGVNNMIFADALGQGIPGKYLKMVGDYTNRMCALMTRARPLTKVAVLYHAEAEWSGGCQLFQTPAAQLARRQISYDVVPDDIFTDTAYYATDTRDGLVVNGNRYQALVVPRARFLPAATAAFVAQAQQTGFPVLFVDAAPEAVCGTLAPFAPKAPVTVVPLQELGQALQALIQPDFQLLEPLPWLRYAHVQADGGEYYLLHNEDPVQPAQVRARLALAPPVYQLDAMENRAYPLPVKPMDDGFVEVELALAPFEMAVLYSGAQVPPNLRPCRTQAHWTAHDAPWEISLWEDEIQKQLPHTALVDINARENRPGYAGKISYRTTVRFEQDLPAQIDLGQVHESCELHVNGVLAGRKIAPPYVFDVDGLVRQGENTLDVEVYNNAGHGDRASQGNPMSLFSATVYGVYGPGGLLGPVRYGFETDGR